MNTGQMNSLFIHEVDGRHVVEGRVLVDDVHDGHGPQKEQVFRAVVAAHRHMVLVEGDDLAFVSGPPTDNLKEEKEVRKEKTGLDGR